MLNVFLLTLQYEPKVFVSTRATFFTIVNTAKIALRVYDGEYSSAHASFTPFDERLSSRLAGSLDMGLLVLGLKLGIFSLLGVFVSTHVVKRLSKSLFMKMEYCLMTHAGGKLLYALHLFSPRLPKTPPHLHRDLPGTQVLRAARVIPRSTAAGNVALARGCSSTANGGVRCECFQPLLCGPTAAETLMGSHWSGLVLTDGCLPRRVSRTRKQGARSHYTMRAAYGPFVVGVLRPSTVRRCLLASRARLAAWKPFDSGSLGRATLKGESLRLRVAAVPAPILVTV